MSQLIKFAKIKNSINAYQIIRGLWCEHPLFQERFSVISEVIPTPASAYSRVFGRMDVVGLFTRELRRKHGKKLSEHYGNHGWHFKKRSQTQREQSKLSAHLWALPGDDSQPQALVVDDVVTTGTTLLQMKAIFADKALHFNTFSYSPALIICA